MAYFDALLQQAITVRNNRAPASNTADLVGGVLVAIVTALQMLLDDKQDSLTFDTTPTADSPNPVTSDGIYQALQAIDLSACEKIVNKVTSIDAQSTDIQYPSAKLLYDSLQALSQVYAAIQHTHAIADIINLQTELNARQLVSNLVTAITAQSTDAQYPSAKLLFDQLALKANQATTYTKAEVDALIGALSTVSFAVVQQLPTSDIQTNVIYLVPASQPGQSNIYNEYIYVNNNWELIGSTSIDLSGYEQTVNKVTAISAQSTDVQYPSARCVWQLIVGINAALTNLDERVTRLESFHYVTYYIRGTSTNVGGTESFTISMLDLLYGTTSNVAFTAEVDANGDWEVEYKGKEIASLANSFLNKTSIVSILFTEELKTITNAHQAFYGCTSLTSVDLSAATFENLQDAAQMFFNCGNLTTIVWSQTLNLNALTKASEGWNQGGMFQNCAKLTTLDWSGQTLPALQRAGNMFNGCTSLTSVDLSAATFAAVDSCVRMFYNCGSLISVDLSAATFSSSQSLDNTFCNCKMLQTVDLSLATLSNCTNAHQAFYGCTSLTSVDLSAATFENLQDAAQMFFNCGNLTTIVWSQTLNLNALTKASEGWNQGGMFQNCAKLTTLDWSGQTLPALQRAGNMFNGCTSLTSVDLSAATFAAVVNNDTMFYNCTSLTTFAAPAAAVAFPTTATNTALSFSNSPLTYQSIVNIANWLADLTGANAKTVTFNATAWNALTAAEQATIQGILSGKNWTLATA